MGSVSAPACPSDMSLRCVVERDAKSQNDIVRGRPAGSSCCTLFCSRVALSVLRLPASSGDSSLTMPALKALLLQAVRDWDKTGLVDGQAAHAVLASSCKEHAGVQLEVLVQEHFVARGALQHMLSESDVEAALVTAIPMRKEKRSKGQAKRF